MELQNRHSIVNLEPEGMSQIINNYHVLEFPVFDDSEVLYEKPDFCFHAIFAHQNPRNVFSVGIDEIYYFCRVEQGGCRENVDLVEGRDFLQELQTVGPDVDADLWKMKNHGSKWKKLGKNANDVTEKNFRSSD